MESANIQALAGTSVVTPREIVRTEAVPANPNRGAELRSEGETGLRASSLSVFRQELRQSLQAFLRLRFNAPPPAFARPAETPDDAAGDALSAAGRLLEEAPTRASNALISFRAKVRQAAEFVQQTLAPANGDIDAVVAKVEDGLDGLENKAAANRELSASVLNVDTRSRQRSSIRIRTQEGDIVTLKLRRADRLSASEVSVSDGQSSAAATEVRIDSRSRMMLSVNGELNDSEFAAIQNVFAQAEDIANRFYGGDIGAAFSLSQGFEFDSEQLARVNMRFRLNQVSRVTQTEIRPQTDQLPVSERQLDSFNPDPAPAPIARPGPVAAPVEPVDRETPVAIVAADTPPEAAAPVAASNTPDAATSLSAALSGFFNQLSDFLRAVGEGFEHGAGSAGFQYHYSESFKLNLLKAVIHTIAPERSEDAAASAEQAIDVVTAAIESDRDDD